MSQRCALRRVSLCTKDNFSTGFLPRQYRRYISSVPERSRKLPNAGDNSVLSPWQRRFVGGVVAGMLAYGGYSYYEQQQYRSSFVTYKLAAKESVSSTASIFHLCPKHESDEFEKYSEAWKRGIWNFHFKQPQIQIVRAYTPLPPFVGEESKEQPELRFLVRHDPHGEVTSYLHRLPIGADVELQGPNLEYTLDPKVKQVVFFAGGTGIAPALQIAHTMFNGQSQTMSNPDSTEKRKLHILWANRRREDCEGGISDAISADPRPVTLTFGGLFGKSKPKVADPISQKPGLIVQELEHLKARYPGQVTVEYFVNAEGTWIDEDAVYNALSRFDDKDFSRGSPSLSEQRQILISGPNGFITHLAGPKEWRNGREEQGNVSRIIAHAISQNPHHVKVWKV